MIDMPRKSDPSEVFRALFPDPERDAREIAMRDILQSIPMRDTSRDILQPVEQTP